MKTDKRKPPPEKLTIMFCPKCGQDDRRNVFKAVHYANGRLCDGVLVTVEYKCVLSS